MPWKQVIVFAVFLALSPVAATSPQAASQEQSRGGTPAVTPQEQRELLEAECGANKGTWLGEFDECEWITETACSELEGAFEECLSECRHDPDVGNCTKVCVPVCSFKLQ